MSGGASSTLALEGSTEAAQFTAAGRTGATHAAEQIQAALHEDHDRLKVLLGRLEDAKDAGGLTATLDELNQLLTEHFAHEEHSKGFYGLVAARSPEYRQELAAMVDEHRVIGRTLQTLVERAKGHAAASDLARAADSRRCSSRTRRAEMKLAETLA